jgi:hypothetical protein
MSEPPARRQFLRLAAASGVIGPTGVALFHTYTGHVKRLVQNLTPNRLTTTVAFQRRGTTVLGRSFEVQSDLGGDTRNVFEDTVLENALRGTVYEVAVRFPDLAVEEEVTEECTVTCTGYADAGERRVEDAIRITISGETTPESVTIDQSYCSGIWNYVAYRLTRVFYYCAGSLLAALFSGES